MDKSETGLLNGNKSNVAVENTTPSEGSTRQVLLCYIKLFLILFPILSLGAVTTANTRLISDQLVYQKLGGDINTNNTSINRTNGSNTETCDSAINKTKEDHIQTEATIFTLYMSIASSISAFIFVPVWGALSDVRGRHLALTISVIGSMIRNASLLAVSINASVPMWVLILGDGLHGMFGKSQSGILLVTCSYIADTLGQGKRTLMMIIADFILLTFQTLSMVGAGYWIKSSGFNGVLISCLALQGLLLIYSVCIFSRVQQPNTQLSQASQTTTSFPSKIKLYFTKSYQAFTRPRTGYIRACLLFLVLTKFTQSIGMYAVESVQTIYCLGPPLCWNSVMLGIFKGVKVGLGGLLPLIIGIVFFKAGPSAWLVFSGLLGTGIQCVIYGFATTDLLMFIAVIPGALHVLVPAVTRSILADLVDSSEKGAALAGYLIISVVAELISNTSFKIIYAETLTIFNRLVFFIAAVFMLVAIGNWGGFGLAKRKHKKSMDMYKRLVQEHS